MIALETLVSFFEDTRELKRTGNARFDIDQVCRWSYFMVDADQAKLTRAGHHLETLGYDVRGFLGPSADTKGATFLRFDRVEQHTPESLFERNAELYRIAREFGLEDYDGMDVGAVDGP